jgi:hypothetical protein
MIIFFSTAVCAELAPIAPVKDAKPQSTVKDITNLNLPYQPADPTTIPHLDIPETIVVDQPAQEIDWTKIPFIPFKTLDLPKAPDPVI